MRARFLSGLLLSACLAATACGSPEEKFEKACQKMASDADDMTKDERLAFCGCVTEKTATMDPAALDTITTLMKSHNSGDNFQDALEQAVEEGSMTLADGQLMFSAMKGCSVDLAM